jgi:hypothetical protein
MQKLIRKTGFTPMGTNKCNDILLSFGGACCVVLHLTLIQPSKPLYTRNLNKIVMLSNWYKHGQALFLKGFGVEVWDWVGSWI